MKREVGILTVVEVNADTWDQEVLKSDVLTLVDFWHERCPWCLRLNPVYEEVATAYEGRVKFVKLNVLASPENRHVAVEQGIMGTPTLTFFCEGRPVETVAGFQPKDRLIALVDDVIAKHRDCLAQSTELPG